MRCYLPVYPGNLAVAWPYQHFFIDTWGVVPGRPTIHIAEHTVMNVILWLKEPEGGSFALLSMLDMSLLYIKYFLCDTLPCRILILVNFFVALLK